MALLRVGPFASIESRAIRLYWYACLCLCASAYSVSSSNHVTTAYVYCITLAYEAIPHTGNDL